jgi:superfamily II DNA or RNA helicase
MFPELRAFQARTIDAVGQAFRQGHRHIMVCAPTGAGKTLIGLKMIALANERGHRGMFICDRVELITQTVNAAMRYGIRDIGVIQADHPLRRNHARCLIASSQTLARRRFPEDVSIAVIDEAHTAYDSWKKIITEDRCRTIGLTATPFTTGLGKLFTVANNAATMHELIRDQVLVKPVFWAARPMDLSGIRIKSTGEWDDDEVTGRVRAIIGDVVGEWKQRASDRKTIAFVPSVEAGEWLVTQFCNAGYRFELISYRTSDSVRDLYINEFRKPDSMIRGLVSVDALAKGFDVTDVGCVIDAKPLRKSLASYIQMIGRGLRSHPGKTECLIHDHSGNLGRFSEAFEDVYFEGVGELDDGKKRVGVTKKVKGQDGKPIETKECPACGYKPFMRQCMACGHIKPRNKTGFETIAGDFVHMGDPSMRRRDKTGLFQQILGYLDESGKPREKQWRTATWYYNQVTGRWPSQQWRDAEPEPCPPALRAKLREIGIAYWKEKQTRYYASQIMRSRC